MSKNKGTSLQNSKSSAAGRLLYFFIHYHFASEKQETYMLNDNKFTVYFHIKLNF